MINFSKLVQEIKDSTGWSDYTIAEKLRGRDNPITQPSVYMLRRRSVDTAGRIARNYDLGRRIIALHAKVKNLNTLKEEGK